MIDLLQEAPDTVILAEDEATLYLQATTQPVWAPRGQTPVVRADPNRQKTNFYGTLNLHTGAVLTTCEPVMDAQASARHLQAILNALPDRRILFLWDSAPWHRGPAIRDLLAVHPRLETMLFPVAAPDLNPQEQVWKATRRAVSHQHTFSRLDNLAQRFAAHLTSNTFRSSFLDRYGYNSIYPMFNGFLKKMGLDELHRNLDHY